MLDQVQTDIRKHNLIPIGCKLVVAVSGGADSLALLHLLWQLRPFLKCQLHVATLDHGLRGEAGAEDARFVEQVAQKWQLPVTSGRVDVPELARETGLGVEAAARQARYHFLAAVAVQIGADRVAVAHHADDQAETVLLHIIRGAGLHGLEGMGWSVPLPEHPELTLIRPLLSVTRSEIEAYCLENHLTPREDATNQDITLLRNYIRWEIVPRLRTLNPEIQRALAQVADIAAVDQAYLEQQFQHAVVPHVHLAEGRLSINRAVFRDLHPALQRRFVLWAVQQLVGPAHKTGYRHILEAVNLALQGQQGALALLRDGLQLRVDYQRLVVERRDLPIPAADIPLLPENTQLPVAVPGITPLPESHWQLTASLEPEVENSAQLALPAGSILLLRTRQPGDRFTPLGLQGHSQKISRWMVNHKIMPAVRNRIPLLIVNGQIAAIALGSQWTISEDFAFPKNRARVIYFQFR